jgi:hypothetical protein
MGGSGEVARISFRGQWRVDRVEGGLLVDLEEMWNILVCSVETPPQWRLVVPHLTVYGRSHEVGRAIQAGGDALVALTGLDARPVRIVIQVDPWYCRSRDRNSLVLPAESPGTEAEAALQAQGIYSEPFHPGHVTLAVTTPPGKRVDVRTAAMWSERCRRWNPSDGGEELVDQILASLSKHAGP